MQCNWGNAHPASSIGQAEALAVEDHDSVVTTEDPAAKWRLGACTALGLALEAQHGYPVA